MASVTANLMEKAFDRFSPKRFFPEPKAKSAIDYGNPLVCPYCKAPMELTKVRKLDGEMEGAYLCRADRAVGCVPDAAVENKTLSASQIVNEDTTYKEEVPND